MTEETLQPLADRVNLGAHEHLITATDEQGRTGRWVVCRPTMGQEIKVGVDYSRLRTPEGGAEPVDIEPMRDNLAFMVATLKHVIVQRPEWFAADPGECRDDALVCELFEKYAAWKDSFRRRVSDEPTADSRPAEPA